METRIETTKFERAEIQERFKDCANLGEVIHRLEGITWSSGEVISEIRVNGLFLNEQDEIRFSQTGLADLETLEITRRRPQELVSEAVASVRDWIPRVKTESLRVSERLRAGVSSESLVTMKRIFEGCAWLTDALLLLKNLYFSLRRSDADFAARWADCETCFTAMTKEILEALERKDYVQLADVLEYDMSANLDNWLELLESADTMRP